MNNHIRVESEPFMKHIVTTLEAPYKPIIFVQVILRYCFLEVDHGCYLVHPSYVPLDTLLELVPCNIVGANDFCNIDLDSTNIETNPIAANIWNLYLDGSKTKEGSGVICVLIELQKNMYLTSRRLEFECTNNIVEYEALILRLKKLIDLEVEVLKVISDSNIVTCQIQNTIHYVFPNIKNYQQ